MDSTVPDIAPVWAALRAGAMPGRSAFSMIFLATTGLDKAPKVRTVVIRRFDQDAGVIGFNTDLRSPKVAELNADGRVSVVGYDNEAGIQVRLDCLAVVHTAGPAHLDAWEKSAGRSRICYRHAYAPGTPLRMPDLGDPTVDMIAPDTPDIGLENFGAVEITINRIDYLDLKLGGHRRAVFDRNNTGWVGRWIAP
jgi:hypothetical protein